MLMTGKGDEFPCPFKPTPVGFSRVSEWPAHIISTAPY